MLTVTVWPLTSFLRATVTVGRRGLHAHSYHSTLLTPKNITSFVNLGIDAFYLRAIGPSLRQRIVYGSFMQHA